MPVSPSALLYSRSKIESFRRSFTTKALTDDMFENIDGPRLSYRVERKFYTFDLMGIRVKSTCPKIDLDREFQNQISFFFLASYSTKFLLIAKGPYTSHNLIVLLEKILYFVRLDKFFTIMEEHDTNGERMSRVRRVLQNSYEKK